MVHVAVVHLMFDMYVVIVTVFHLMYSTCM